MSNALNVSELCPRDLNFYLITGGTSAPQASADKSMSQLHSAMQKNDYKSSPNKMFPLYRSGFSRVVPALSLRRRQPRHILPIAVTGTDLRLLFH
jgi:hypothetical protein